ncbi:DUF5020 family protein [Aureibacter tunicatorum]|uniref:DUF5020 family protein n=1 Tax=Aureibacter tunicatorum TaxID=866807 RepID=A0AAE3XRK1_9BACT|nr:DUF5020 family protein [Aureibacter tunicatorum]MDR6241312.1 hypothetical protein [Aureibacter tunicatorum]BDD03571.1 DUF5020 domain-containing protein [Aureibacter tunicatorum]
MKKALLFFSAVFVLSTLSYSQNIQLHYDYGRANDGDINKDRNYFTVTTEMFKPDKLGSTFFFADMDFAKEGGGMSFAYWEIARKFTLPGKFKNFNFHIEYNDGTANFITPAALTGIGYDFGFKGWIFTTNYLARIPFEGRLDGQFTMVWHKKFFNNKLHFTGFLDIWTSDEFEGTGKQITFLTEPQLWYEVIDNFDIGGEVEISKNFFTYDGDIEVMPTVALRYRWQ